MDLVKYEMRNVPTFSPNFKEDLKRKEYLFIENITIDGFLEYDPPCKECVVQATCLHNATHIEEYYTTFIYLQMCDKLKVFITYDERFYK